MRMGHGKCCLSLVSEGRACIVRLGHGEWGWFIGNTEGGTCIVRVGHGECG